MYEQTLVLLKPDAVQRGLIGEILSRFERKGLKIVAMKMVQATEAQSKEHYNWSDEEKIASGNRSIELYKAKGMDLEKTPLEVGESVQRKLMGYLAVGPIVAMVIEGAHAIEHVRKVVGHGSPLKADVGTIRADLTIDSYEAADEADRAARNLVHASSSVAEAEREIAVWFKKDEVVSYDLAIEKVLYDLEWEKK